MKSGGNPGALRPINMPPPRLTGQRRRFLPDRMVSLRIKSEYGGGASGIAPEWLLQDGPPPGSSCGQGDTSEHNLSRRPDFFSPPGGEIEEDWQCPPVSRFTPFEKSLTSGGLSTTKIDRSTARFSWYQPPSLAGGPSHPVQMVGGQARTALSGLGKRRLSAIPLVHRSDPDWCWPPPEIVPLGTSAVVAFAKPRAGPFSH